MDGDNPKGHQMDPVAGPVVENPSRPAMGEAGAGDVMGAAALPAEGHRMTEPAPAADAGASAGVDAEYPDMEPPVATTGGEGAEAFAAGSYGEAYLRLVIDVDDGEMKVVDARVVDGPVVRTDLTGQMAYEALIRGRRVAADAFDDLTQQHAFPPPDDPTLGHHTSTTSHFQFVARVPRSEVTEAELADLEITLVRPASTTQLAADVAAAPGLSLEAAALEAGEEPPEVVARLEGIDLNALPSGAAEAVRERLR
ncbi:MAG: hypothetical protein M3291_03260 [Actinomycetota bacterium]|nr:hypothetical protein [Actinomycetota bacterium]